ncbi:uncharacterized protein LOC135170621 isoform X2 [Diachasmimorpha longicaudata]
MKSVKIAISFPENSPKRQKSPEPLNDENSDLNAQALKTETPKCFSRKLLEFTPSLFRKRAHHWNKSPSDNELVTPGKVPKMSREQVEENSAEYKGYFSPCSADINSIDNGDDTTGKIDKFPEESKIESENIIFSQLSETSREHFLGHIMDTTPRESVTREAGDSYQICSSTLRNLSGKSSQKPELCSPTLLSQTKTRILNQKKVSGKCSSQNFYQNVPQNQVLKFERNLENKWRNNYNVINQQLCSAPDQIQTSDYIVPSSEFSRHVDPPIVDQKTVSRKNFLINHLEEENRSVTFSQHLPATWGNAAQRNEMSPDFSTASGRPCTGHSSTGIQEFTHLLNKCLLTQNVYQGFQILNNSINVPLINDIASNFGLKLTQSSVCTSIISQGQSETDDISPTIPIISPNEEQKHSDSQVMLIITDEEEEVSSQQIISPGVTEVFLSQEDIPSDQSRQFNAGDGLLSPSPVTYQLVDDENKCSPERNFFSFQRTISGSGNILTPRTLRFSDGMELSKDLRTISVDSHDDVSQENVSNGDQQEMPPPKKILPTGDPNLDDESPKVSQPVPMIVNQSVPEDDLHSIREHQSVASSQKSAQLTPSSSLPRDNSNPWLNVTSQDFSEEGVLDNGSVVSQDSGQASIDPLASQRSFVSSSPEEDNDRDEDDESVNSHLLSIKEILRLDMSTIKKCIEKIIRRLESEI